MEYIYNGLKILGLVVGIFILMLGIISMGIIAILKALSSYNEDIEKMKSLGGVFKEEPINAKPIEKIK